MDFASKVVPAPSLGIDFEILERDTDIGPAIEGGLWERHETRLFLAHARPGTRVVDLGANVGWYACQAILAGAEVDAFEPVPAIAAIAERNMQRAMEKGPGRGRLHNAAAGAEAGRASIALSADNRGDNRVLDAGADTPGDLGPAETLEIEVARVDDLVRGPADLLKVDTQGSEWLALQGARELLAASPSLALLLEFWPYALRGATPRELLALLESEGFTLGKATDAPYPMAPERILRQAEARDPLRGGLDLYATRGRPFHVLGVGARLHGLWRSLREA